jgi:hypothetical protein
VPTQPALIVWTFMVVVAIGIMTILLEPSRSVDMMVPVPLLQLFSAWHGCEVPALRVHYDYRLTI